MKLKLIDFIKEHADWEVLLNQAPYCLSISRDQKFGRNLIMFKYSQQDSDFSNDIVKECRGIILDEDTLEPVSIPYFKFFNVGEPNAAEVDWASAKVLQKIDGSLIKVVKFSSGEILVSTNGVIDVFKCELNSQIGCPYYNFGELFWEAVRNQMIDCGYSLDENDPVEWLADKLLPNFTYMFELCSPYNRIIVPHKETKLYFHGWRDNISLNEMRFNICILAKIFGCPEEYNLKSLDECVAATQAMPWDEEGYVVVDKNFNRVKIKSPAYCAIHHLAPNGNLSIRRAIDLYMENEQLEFLAYFPEYKSAFDEINKRFDHKFMELGSDAVILFAKIDDGSLPTRKDQAAWILANTKHSGILFKLLNGYVAGDSDDIANIDRHLDELKQIMIDLYHRNASSFVSLLGY
jgi:hypothetical protein